MTYQCTKCDKVFVSRSDVSAHNKIHKKEKAIVIRPCLTCQMDFDCLVRRKNGQYEHRETCSLACAQKLRGERARQAIRITAIHNAQKIHGDKFDYSRMTYIDCKTTVTIGCPVHGFFDIIYKEHLGKHGCNECGFAVRDATLRANGKENSISLSTILERFNEKHGTTYSYPKIADEYNGVFWKKNKITIICPKHGEFMMNPNGHANGSGCMRCCRWVSKPETSWLNSIGLPNNAKYRQVRICGRLVDGYDAETNTVYQFNGDYWHGNPYVYNPFDVNPSNGKTYGSLYNRTICFEEKIRQAGYNLVIKWG